MDVKIPLDQMTVVEKLRAIETIWNDLQRDPASVPSPAWHNNVLSARETRASEGNSRYGDWSEAKDWIRQQTR